MEETSISVLVADDHPIVREHVGEAIAADGRLRLVGEACDGEEALRMAETLRPDAVVLDVAMPRLDGADVLREVRDRQLPVRVLLLPGHARSSQVYRALCHQPDSLLSVDAGADRICDEIVAMQRGTGASAGALSPGRAKAMVMANGRVELTGRESDVLRLSADGLTRAQIGQELHLTTSTVRAVRHDICTKLGAPSIQVAIVMALHIGLLD